MDFIESILGDTSGQQFHALGAGCSLVERTISFTKSRALNIGFLSGPNSHLGHLARGDAFVVTADSVVCSENFFL